jgi:hemolysin activation/secretion protein
MKLEARYQVGKAAPYAFYDAGHVKTNKNAFAVASNDRDIAGYGIGMRFTDQAWSLDAALAWRSNGGVPTSDTVDRDPRLWVTAGWRF